MKIKPTVYMRTLLLLVSITFSTVVFSQNYEVIRPELKSNDFAKTLGFIKRINEKNLMLLFSTKDSVTYMINDSVDYSYNLKNLEEFEQRMRDNELVYLSKIDSVYNKDKRSFDYYFTNNDNSKDFIERKFFNDNGLVYKELSYGENDSTFEIHEYKYDSENRLTLNEVTCALYNFKYRVENIWHKDYLQSQTYVIYEYDYIQNIKVEYCIKGLIINYSYVKENKVTNNILDSFSYTVEYSNDGYIKNISGIDKSDIFRIDFNFETSEFSLKKEYKGILSKLLFKLK